MPSFPSYGMTSTDELTSGLLFIHLTIMLTSVITDANTCAVADVYDFVLPEAVREPTRHQVLENQLGIIPFPPVLVIKNTSIYSLYIQTHLIKAD